MHYRAVILILASNNNQIFNNCRKVWKRYMNIDPTIKVYFVYGELTEPLHEYDPDSDIVFNDVKESYPVLIEKTIRAMKLIDSRVTYDFFIRTNLSTFWDFNKLHLHLNELPRQNCYSGDGPLPYYNSNGYYLSGTDTIVTPEMIKSITHNQHLVEFSITEDCAMGKYFNGILKAPMLPNRICFFEDITSIHEDEKIKDRVTRSMENNIDHYRVKTLHPNREEIDINIYENLLQLIYNIPLR